MSSFFGSSNPKYSEEQRKYMKQFGRRAIPFLISGAVFNVIIITLVIKNKIDLSQYIKTRANDLQDIPSKIGFVLKYSTPGVLWLWLCVYSVIRIRVRSPAMDPLANEEQFVLKAKNILQNSFEQFILSLVSQLILITHLDSVSTVKYIPALSFMFILGRIAFWLGYPNYRSFGLITSLAPITVTIFYISYRFIDENFGIFLNGITDYVFYNTSLLSN